METHIPYTEYSIVHKNIRFLIRKIRLRNIEIVRFYARKSILFWMKSKAQYTKGLKWDELRGSWSRRIFLFLFSFIQSRRKTNDLSHLQKDLIFRISRNRKDDISTFRLHSRRSRCVARFFVYFSTSATALVLGVWLQCTLLIKNATHKAIYLLHSFVLGKVGNWGVYRASSQIFS